MNRSLGEIKKAILWGLSPYTQPFSMWEVCDDLLDTYPTSVFIVKSNDICKELIKDITQN